MECFIHRKIEREGQDVGNRGLPPQKARVWNPRANYSWDHLVGSPWVD